MITVDSQDLIRAQDFLQQIPGGVQKATARAINRAAESARTAASRAVRKDYFIDNKTVLNTIRIRRASVGNFSASVESRGKLIPLAKWKAAPLAKPAMAQIKKAGASGWGKGAFWATMKSGHEGIFGRLGKKRKPIQERMGPSVPQLLQEESIVEIIENRAAEVASQRLDHEINRILQGAGK